jgi:transcriptional regulator with PAS, ATPase and Fis domain
VISLAHKIANIDSTVLILGESGTGKELVAREIHEQSIRCQNMFLKVNCGSIPEGLLESELFGYEKGAFTGAAPRGRPGMFAIADKGTILLDEIGDLPLNLQVKLLRVLQDKVFIPLGSSREVRVDVRIIAATNENLEKMVLEKKFRHDLYYRLNVVHIHIPPLRQRIDEIPALIDFFVDKINRRYNLNKSFNPQVVRDFLEYSWPGNVRELENVIERIMVTSENDTITRENIKGYFKNSLAGGDNYLTISGLMPLPEACARVEDFLLQEARKKYKTTYQIAAALGISQPSVSRKIKKYGNGAAQKDTGRDRIF